MKMMNKITMNNKMKILWMYNKNKVHRVQVYKKDRIWIARLLKKVFLRRKIRNKSDLLPH